MITQKLQPGFKRELIKRPNPFQRRFILDRAVFSPISGGVQALFSFRKFQTLWEMRRGARAGVHMRFKRPVGT